MIQSRQNGFCSVLQFNIDSKTNDKAQNMKYWILDPGLKLNFPNKHP